MKFEFFQLPRRLAHPVAAAKEVHEDRTGVVLRITDNALTGYGEIFPSLTSVNGDPSRSETLRELTETILPRVESALRNGNRTLTGGSVQSLLDERPTSRFGGALIEMAMWDLEMQRQQRSLTDEFEPKFPRRRQTTISGLVPPLLEEIEADRVRIKVGGDNLEALDMGWLSESSVDFHLDLNGTATSVPYLIEWAEKLQQLPRFRGFEQPFAVGDWISPSQLHANTSCAVIIDEGLRSYRDLQNMIRYKSGTHVCIKPTRVGGISRAVSLVHECRSSGIEFFFGGFFESELSRGLIGALQSAFTPNPSDSIHVQDSWSGAFGERPWGLGRRVNDGFLENFPPFATLEVPTRL